MQAVAEQVGIKKSQMITRSTSTQDEGRSDEGKQVAINCVPFRVHLECHLLTNCLILLLLFLKISFHFVVH